MVVVLTNNSRKEFFLQAESEEEAIRKINDTGKKYPEYARKYVQIGLKLIPAKSVTDAKNKFDQFNVLEPNGQFSFI